MHYGDATGIAFFSAPSRPRPDLAHGRTDGPITAAAVLAKALLRSIIEARLSHSSTLAAMLREVQGLVRLQSAHLKKGMAMIEQILEGYGAISALSTVAILIWGWAHDREVA